MSHIFIVVCTDVSQFGFHVWRQRDTSAYATQRVWKSINQSPNQYSHVLPDKDIVKLDVSFTHMRMGEYRRFVPDDFSQVSNTIGIDKLLAHYMDLKHKVFL